MIFTRLKTLAVCTVLLSGFYPGFLWAENTQTREPVNMSRHLDIRNLTSASAPRFVSPMLPDFADGKVTILFTFQDGALTKGAVFRTAARGDQSYSTAPSRSVSVAFGHEGWLNAHQLEVVNNTDNAGNRSSVFFLYYDISRETLSQLLREQKQIEYRYIVDGVWMSDPLNPISTKKLNGAVVSYISPNDAPPPPTISPEVLSPLALDRNKLAMASPEQASLATIANSRQPRTVFLRYIADPGQTITVAGSFNSFEPWMYELRPKSRDLRNPDKIVYEAEIRLLAGQYFYHFVINGTNVLDPLNVRQGSGPEGRLYSLLSVE